MHGIARMSRSRSVPLTSAQIDEYVRQLQGIAEDDSGDDNNAFDGEVDDYVPQNHVNRESDSEIEQFLDQPNNQHGQGSPSPLPAPVSNAQRNRGRGRGRPRGRGGSAGQAATPASSTDTGLPVGHEELASVKSGSRRWPIHVFFNVLDLAAINAWVLYKEVTGVTISRREFILQLCEELRSEYIEDRQSKKQRQEPLQSTSTRQEATINRKRKKCTIGCARETKLQTNVQSAANQHVELA